MPLTIVHEDEQGRKKYEHLIDLDGVLLRMARATHEEVKDRLRLVDFIDPYGITLFNILQLEQLQTEIVSLLEAAKTDAEEQFLYELLDFIENCRKDVSPYIKIYGD